MTRTIDVRSYQDALAGEMQTSGDFGTDAGPSGEPELDTLSGQLADDDDETAEDRVAAAEYGRDGLGSLEPPADDATRPHEYDVVSGEVRNWRQYAPAREAERATEDGTDDEPRFSGGGAADFDDLPFVPRSEWIPSDGAFMNDRHKAAPELANLAEKLIHEHGFFEDLVNCRIDYKWRRKGTNSKGKRAIGKLERVSGIWSAYVPYNFVVWLAADTARLANFTDRQVEAALFHQLCHVGQDAKGNWIRVGHDFEGFGTEVRHYGPWTEDLKIGSQAFTVAVQLGLDLDADDDDEEDDEDDRIGMEGDGAFDPEQADLSDLPDGDEASEEAVDDD
jgi:hypothetical protein